MSAVRCLCASAATSLLRVPDAPRPRGRNGSARSGVFVNGATTFGDAGAVAAMPPQGGVEVVSRRQHVRGVGHAKGCSRCVARMGGEAGKEPLVVGNGYVAETGSEKKFLTLPTILTLSRVAAVPALLAGTLTLSHGDLGFWNQKRFWVCGILSMGLHFSSGVLDCGGFEGFRLDVECSLCF
jgi:hypothetical protein